VNGRPNIAAGCTLATRRNYLQSLHAAVADKSVYVGGLYIGAAIERVSVRPFGLVACPRADQVSTGLAGWLWFGTPHVSPVGHVGRSVPACSATM
jgi:hypothetical protein